VVDNRQGADARFASEIRRNLVAAGFEVEMRPPSSNALFDTSVHFVVEGVSVRVPDELSPEQLRAVERAVRAAESHRSERQRYRAVPIYLGDTSRVLAWVDVFEP
jgi:hypothetical protein